MAWTCYACAALRWRHNGRDSVSNDQGHYCLLTRLFRRRSKKTYKIRVTGLCAGNSPGTGEFPAQMASNAENVLIWWRHHGTAPISPACADDALRMCHTPVIPEHCYPYDRENDQAHIGVTDKVCHGNEVRNGNDRKNIWKNDDFHHKKVPTSGAENKNKVAFIWKYSLKLLQDLSVIENIPRIYETFGDMCFLGWPRPLETILLVFYACLFRQSSCFAREMPLKPDYMM